MATLEGEWYVVYCIIEEDIIGIDVGIHGDDTHPYLEFVVHMREVALVGSLGIAFSGYT